MGYALIALGLDIGLTLLGLFVGMIWQKIIDKKKEK